MRAHHLDPALVAELAWRQEVIRSAAGQGSRRGSGTRPAAEPVPGSLAGSSGRAS